MAGHSTKRASAFVAALACGLLAGFSLVFAAAWLLLESATGALLLSGSGLAFFLPLACVVAAAVIRASRRNFSTPIIPPSQAEKLSAAAYALCVIPFWFASVALYQGRHALALMLFAVYIVCAVYPLRAAYLVRLRS